MRMRGAGLALVFAAAMLLCCATLARADDRAVVDERLKFSFVIPAGFEASPELAAADPEFLYAYIGPGTEKMDRFIIIERMGGTIGRESVGSLLPPTHRVMRLPWAGFDIEAVEFEEQAGELKALNLNAQVPLREQAIQVRVFGDAEKPEEIRAAMTAVLASLKGESNWIRSVMPASISSAPWYGIVLLITLIVVFFAAVLGLWWISRRTTRASFLLLAGLIFLIGIGMPGGGSREARVLLKPMFCFVGLTGLILGCTTRFRRGPAVSGDPTPIAASEGEDKHG